MVCGGAPAKHGVVVRPVWCDVMSGTHSGSGGVSSCPEGMLSMEGGGNGNGCRPGRLGREQRGLGCCFLDAAGGEEGVQLA